MKPKSYYLGQGTLPYGARRINEHRIGQLPEHTNLFIEKGVVLDDVTLTWLRDAPLRVFWILNVNK